MIRSYKKSHNCSEEQAEEEFNNLSPEDKAALEEASCNGISWANAKERGEIAKSMLENVLNFLDVNVFVDLSREEIIAELDKIKY